MADICDLHRMEEVIRSDKQLRRDENNFRPRHRWKDNNGYETDTTKIWHNMCLVWNTDWRHVSENAAINIWIPRKEDNCSAI